MFICCTKCSSEINLIYSGQVFSHNSLASNLTKLGGNQTGALLVIIVYLLPDELKRLHKKSCWCHDSQHNDIQHIDTQYKGLRNTRHE